MKVSAASAEPQAEPKLPSQEEPTRGSGRLPVRVEGGHGAACLVRPRPRMPLLPS
jgi:hypothetical protein